MARPRCTRRRRSALTLVELVITILIMGILAGMATPKFTGALQRMRVESACRRIRADLAFARQSAISKSASQAVEFTVNSGLYTMPGVSSLDRAASAYFVDLAAEPYEVSILSASLGGDARVLFDLYGKPDSGGVITVGAGSVTGTVTLDANSGRATIP